MRWRGAGGAELGWAGLGGGRGGGGGWRGCAGLGWASGRLGWEAGLGWAGGLGWLGEVGLGCLEGYRLIKCASLSSRLRFSSKVATFTRCF